MSMLHGRLLKYPIFQNISEIKCMRKTVFSLPSPPERLGTRLFTNKNSRDDNLQVDDIPTSFVKSMKSRDVYL